MFLLYNAEVGRGDEGVQYQRRQPLMWLRENFGLSISVLTDVIERKDQRKEDCGGYACYLPGRRQMGSGRGQPCGLERHHHR